jgi:cystathionine gamma-synthase
MPGDDKKKLDTILAQAGTHYQDIAAVSSRDVVPPLHLASTYERGEDGLDYPGGFIYSRHTNPTRSNLEAVLTQAEAGAEWTATFASGMAAANAILQALGANAFLVMPNDLYHGVRYLVNTVFGTWGLPFVAVDMSDPAEVEAALATAFRDAHTARVLLWLESPSNPLLQVGCVLCVCVCVSSPSTMPFISYDMKRPFHSKLFPIPILYHSRWQTSPPSSVWLMRPPAPTRRTSSASPTSPG